MINIIIIILIAAPTIYTFSFAIHSWKNGNKLAAVGASMIATSAILLPAIQIFAR